jgi:hypothetical protein
MSAPRRSHGRAIALLATAMTLAATLLFPVSATAAPEPCTDPPAVVPQHSLAEGQTGRAWTAVKGRTPVSFDVEILGVLPDGIAPGIDFVLIQTSGPVIDETGGIAAGMSGSPVYIDGKLAGAIAYGFFAADQTIGGMTPAEPMIDLFSYSTTARSARLAKVVELSPELRTAAALAAGEPKTAYGQAQTLPMPLAVSGVPEGDLSRVTERMAREGARVIPYISGSAPTPARTTTAPDPVAPGQPFAAALSYGLVTYAGIGTATAVCGDFAIAFGHPFRFRGGGPSSGFNGADIVTVISDPSSIFGPFKIGTVGELHGVVDQDRIAGIRGVEGSRLRGNTTIRSDVTNTDTGRRRTDETVVVAKGGWVRWITLDHVWYALVAGLQARSGTVDLDWTITGTADGAPFSVSHRNRFSGALWQPTYEINSVMRSLQGQRTAKVRIMDVSVTASVSEKKVRADMGDVLTASSVKPALKVRDRLPVVAGDTVRIRVPITTKGPKSTTYPVDFSMGVPIDIEDGGRLRIEAGQPRTWLRADTFAKLLKKISNMGRGDEIRGWLRMEGMARAVKVTVPLDHVLRSERTQIRLLLD